METIILNTPSAHCGSCRAHIQEVFEDETGVARADLDIPSHQTTVSFDPAVIDRSRIIEVITEAGYPVENQG